MGRSRSRSRSDSDDEGTRLHIGDLAPDCSKRELEKEFQKFGELVELWLARTPPCFGFAVFKNKFDAYDAMDSLNGKVIGSSRVKVSLALPRAHERTRRVSYDANMKCYNCGERGHFVRDCERINRRKRGRSPSSRDHKKRRTGHRSTSRSRSRSKGHHRREGDSMKRKEASRSRSDKVDVGDKREKTGDDVAKKTTSGGGHDDDDDKLNNGISGDSVSITNNVSISDEPRDDGR